ncbi:MAG: hypothetical protein WA040_07920 [Anaerolineae bacterium]
MTTYEGKEFIPVILPQRRLRLKPQADMLRTSMLKQADVRD